jgi:hexulose-6-phosphate isomerase
MNRRQFTKNAMLASSMLTLSPFLDFASAKTPAARTLKKGIMWGTIGVGKTILEKFQACKEAGFDGIEIYSHLDRAEVLKARDTTGLKIPSLCGSLHWKYQLSDPDPKVREQGVEALRVSIEDAKAYGADTVLLVPGSVSQTVSYRECWDRTIAEIKKLVRLAEKNQVKIAIENVWNNFIFSPVEALHYLDQFRSPMLTFYLDCGNILVYGWPEQWIRTLGKRLAKVHIKEFSNKLADSQGKRAGFKVKLQEGDVNWPAVMKALDEIGYNSWITVEQSGGNTPEGLKDLCNSMTNIIAS